MKVNHIISIALIVLVMFVMLVSCASTEQGQTPDFKNENNSIQSFIEEANGRELFVFLPSGGDDFEKEFFLIGSLSAKAEPSNWMELNNKDFYGVFGYLVSDTPKEKYGSLYYEIQLSNGKHCFYRPSGGTSDFSEIYKWSVFPYEEYLKGKEKVDNKMPIYEGSSIYYTDGDGVENFELSNGVKISSGGRLENCINFASFAKTNEVKDKIITLILENGLSCSYDDFDENGFVHQSTGLSDYFYCYVGANPDSSWLRFYLSVRSYNWIFADSLTISNGIEKLDLSDLYYEFDRKAYGSHVSESVDIYVSKELESVLRKSLETRTLKVRVRGDDGRKDIEFSEADFKGLESILQIYDLFQQ